MNWSIYILKMLCTYSFHYTSRIQIHIHNSSEIETSYHDFISDIRGKTDTGCFLRSDHWDLTHVSPHPNVMQPQNYIGSRRICRPRPVHLYTNICAQWHGKTYSHTRSQTYRYKLTMCTRAHFGPVPVGSWAVKSHNGAPHRWILGKSLPQ